MLPKESNKFDGMEWVRKKGLSAANSWQRKMDLSLPHIKGKVVLDVGCGSGAKADIFSRSARKIYGIDINRGDIENAKKKYQANNLFFKKGDAARIPFKDNTFDLVYGHWLIEHLEEPAKFINEAYRVLKPDGILVLWVPNLWSITGLLIKILPDVVKLKILEYLGQRELSMKSDCYYRANSTSQLDSLTKDKFQRIYLEWFDDIRYFRSSRALSYLWLIRHRLTDNKLLNWTHPHFYVEYQKTEREN